MAGDERRRGHMVDIYKDESVILGYGASVVVGGAKAGGLGLQACLTRLFDHG